MLTVSGYVPDTALPAIPETLSASVLDRPPAQTDKLTSGPLGDLRPFRFVDVSEDLRAPLGSRQLPSSFANRF